MSPDSDSNGIGTGTYRYSLFLWIRIRIPNMDPDSHNFDAKCKKGLKLTQIHRLYLELFSQGSKYYTENHVPPPLY